MWQVFALILITLCTGLNDIVLTLLFVPVGTIYTFIILLGKLYLVTSHVHHSSDQLQPEWSLVSENSPPNTFKKNAGLTSTFDFNRLVIMCEHYKVRTRCVFFLFFHSSWIIGNVGSSVFGAYLGLKVRIFWTLLLWFWHFLTALWKYDVNCRSSPLKN